ncbi:MAG TPA: hypothetical protein VFF06_23330 [Polyangia bacterium]|nr:hypothetical protein [Polyangia bacterium]
MSRLEKTVAIVVFALSGCRSTATEAVQTEPMTIPQSSGWATKVLPAIHMSLRLAPGVELIHVEEQDRLMGPNFFSHHASGKEAFWFVPELYTPSRTDQLAAQIRYCTTGAKKRARVLYRDENTFIVRVPAEGRSPDHCEVTACSTTKRRFCVEASAFAKNAECAELAAMMSSMRDLP